MPDTHALVDAHAAFLYRYALRLCRGRAADAEDLVQITFLNAHRHRDQLRDPGAARAWLCTILRNARHQSHRRKRLPSAPLDSLPEPPAAPDADPPDFTAEELHAALDALPDEFREPLLLFYFEHLSYKRIGAELNVPVGTVMSRLSRGKERLKQALSVSKTRPTAVSP